MPAFALSHAAPGRALCFAAWALACCLAFLAAGPALAQPQAPGEAAQTKTHTAAPPSETAQAVATPAATGQTGQTILAGQTGQTNQTGQTVLPAGPGQSVQSGQAAQGAGAQAGAAQPAPPPDATWAFGRLGLEKTLYPSLMIAMATMRHDQPPDPRELGDSGGFVGVEVVAPRAGAKAVLKVTSPSNIVQSRLECQLPSQGERYELLPYLKNMELLTLVRQPFAESITAKLWLDNVSVGERTDRVVVRSINDCLYRYEENGQVFDFSWLFGAYVNENHPEVEVLLAQALATGEVQGIGGYQGAKDQVRREIKAVWAAIKARGIRYSNMTRASAQSEAATSQHVRLLGEALESRQANCVEGSCLLASVCYKMGLEPFLVLVPGHMFFGVFLDAEARTPLFLETTALGQASFEQAAQAGLKQAGKLGIARLSGAGLAEIGRPPAPGRADSGVRVVFISGVRVAGVLPIREIEAERKRFQLLKDVRG